jgi:hypothetical protein
VALPCVRKGLQGIRRKRDQMNPNDCTDSEREEAARLLQTGLLSMAVLLLRLRDRVAALEAPLAPDPAQPAP